MLDDESDVLFRKAFGTLAKQAREASGFSVAELYARTAETMQNNAGQGNQQAIRDLEKAAGWINPSVFTVLLHACGRPDAEALGVAYETLKSAVDGRSEGYYRR